MSTDAQNRRAMREAARRLKRQADAPPADMSHHDSALEYDIEDAEARFERRQRDLESYEAWRPL